MKFIKNITIVLVALFCAIGVAGWLFGGEAVKSPVEVGGNFTNSRHRVNTATTTATYKTAGAASSTAIIADMVDAKSADLRFMVHSTTTEPTLAFDLYATQDAAGSSRNWFKIDDAITTQLISTSTDNLYGFYSFPIANLSTNYLKVEYAVSGAASDIYLEAIRRNEIK